MWASILACVPEDKSQVEFFTEAVFAFAAQKKTVKRRAEWQREMMKALSQASKAIDHARRVCKT